jgi:hypothetical protein
MEKKVRSFGKKRAFCCAKEEHKKIKDFTPFRSNKMFSISFNNLSFKSLELVSLK